MCSIRWIELISNWSFGCVAPLEWQVPESLGCVVFDIVCVASRF
jgi:hypothetical protein